MYLVLVAIFFFSLLLLAGVIAVRLALAFALHGRVGRWWSTHRRWTRRVLVVWFGGYAAFIAFATGPDDLSVYPPPAGSPYRLPWQAGVSRLVAQGNRSFASHRGGHLRAWDFWMPIGTEVLAAREGQVLEIEDTLDGIGLRSNFITIMHDDGTRATYAHIRRGGAVVKVGIRVHQGQLLAYSGMVGQTIFPHLHFVVLNREGTASIPISFVEVPGGVPLAGHWYQSENIRAQ